jgi:hypothetical protein
MAEWLFPILAHIAGAALAFSAGFLIGRLDRLDRRLRKRPPWPPRT